MRSHNLAEAVLLISLFPGLVARMGLQPHLQLQLQPQPHRARTRAWTAGLTIRLLCLALLPLCLAPDLHAARRAVPTVTLNFPDADLEAVARAMAAILDRPIVLDPRVRGKITLYTEQAVTPAQAYAFFLSSLRGLGFAVIDQDGLLKIVPEGEAKLQSTAVLGPAAGRGQGDQIVTQVFRVLHENASNLVTVLRPLISPNNTINANAGNNTLVITDYASNLQRLGTLIAALDTPSATDVEVIVLQHALASSLALTVQRLLEAGAPAAGQGGALPVSNSALVLADPGINALLVRAPNAARLAAVRALVARLDVSGSAGSSDVHVVYLKNADAARLAAVLRAAFPVSGEGARSSGAASSGAALTGSGSGAAGSTASSVGNMAGSGTASAQSTAPVTASAAPSTGGYIQADPATNSLIITAPAPLFRELVKVIEQLDSRRAQLYVESLVVEVDASKARDVGVKWQQIFNISTTEGLTLGTVAEALESMSGTNILSTANVVTLDNEEAKIVVGQNVPFVTGSYTTTSSSSSNPFQTIERKDVGITLRIRPQIGSDGQVRLTIFQESSSISATAAVGTANAGPTTNKRSIETHVVVRDGKIVVLGGLIEDSYTGEAAQIPVLAELPVLGGLFRSRSRTRKKTNLIVFLRPVVMPDDAAVQQLSLDRYDFIRARQHEFPAEIEQVLPGHDLPQLRAPAAAGPGT